VTECIARKKVEWEGWEDEEGRMGLGWESEEAECVAP